ncbi:BnaC08g10740D [Brassica napus]|uniref:BnaC08g10740D protein n=1 Tax=Brassica napus TaxID=3708 RepID=A0A078I1J6_BRANA|nr:BnaC09g21930D [Brassica napus]CDY43479.1 BnaC08g10740D [Brassica napus]
MLGSLYLVFLDLVLPHRLFGNLFLNCFSVRYPVRLEGFGALAPYHQFVEGVRFTDLFHESSLEMSSARCFLSGIYCIVGSVPSLFHPSSKVFSFGSGNMSVVRRLKSPGMALSSAGLVSGSYVACRLLCPNHVFHQVNIISVSMEKKSHHMSLTLFKSKSRRKAKHENLKTMIYVKNYTLYTI